MTEYVIVRINEQLIPEFQINYSVNNTLANKRVISSWSDISVKSHETLILIISANMVFSNDVVIPSKNEEIIRQSIPFTLEEMLANEIVDNHYAYKQITENNFCVASINKLVMDKIIAELGNNSLKCKELYSELYSVPNHNAETSALSLDNYFIVRDGDNGTTIKKSMLKNYFESNNTDSQIFYSQKEFNINELPNTKNKIVKTSLLQAKEIIKNGKVNLFQAEYSQNDENHKSINPLKRVTFLGVALIVSWLLINVFNLISISSDINDLKAKQGNLLLELIPNASQTELKDPYSAIQSRLKISKNQSSNNTIGFIQTLSYLGQTLVQFPSIQVQSLRQRDSKLEVSVRADSTSILNQFQSALENNVLAMSVKTGTREVKNNGVNSVITMEAL